MSCKSNIYVATTSSSSVLANGVLPLATIVRRRGCDLNLSGNSIAITDCGSNYYRVIVNATFTAPVAGVVTLNIQQNGTNVTGGTASTTITVAATEVRSLTIPVEIRTFNNSGVDAITIINSGVAATFSNITIAVEKL